MSSGCTTPFARIDCARSSNLASSKCTRGCKALGSIKSIGNSLLSAEGAAPATEEANEFPIDLIDPSALQPRVHSDEAKLEELAQSIRANGVVQP